MRSDHKRCEVSESVGENKHKTLCNEDFVSLTLPFDYRRGKVIPRHVEGKFGEAYYMGALMDCLLSCFTYVYMQSSSLFEIVRDRLATLAGALQ